jgi:thioredoxin 1
LEIIPYALGAAFAIFVGFQLLFWLKTRSLLGRPAPDLSDLLESPLPSEGKVLFYFYSAHCGPCLSMTPRVDRLRERHSNVVKVDVSETPALAARFGVSLTPTVLVVERGTVTQAMVGLQSARRLERALA